MNTIETLTPTERREAIARMTAEVIEDSDKQSWLTLMSYSCHRDEVRDTYLEIPPLVKEFNRLASEFRVRPFYRDEQNDFEKVKSLYNDICTLRRRWFGASFFEVTK